MNNRSAHRPKRLSCPPQLRPLWNSTVLALIGALAAVSSVRASELYARDGLQVELDTTLRYSAGIRLGSQSPYLLKNANGDDGDRDFAAGRLFLNRFDFDSVLSLTANDFGFQASADGWYDTVYHMRTSNNSPATFNALSVPYTSFPRATRNLEGQYIELGDAFAYVNIAIAQMPVSIRIGRQTVLWGESVFFDENSIAAAQAPIDYLRNIVPQNYSNTVYLPLNQLFVSVQPFVNVTIAAYYQFEWRASRVPGVGSYFSATDILGAGAERVFLANSEFLLRTPDRTPSDGAHYGISLRTTFSDIDTGIYALRYASQYPWLRFGYYASPEPTGEAGEFWSVFPGRIDLYGASISSYVGDSTIAGEISARVNAPILGGTIEQQYADLRNTTATSNYARGNTAHAQISLISALQPSMFWDSASFTGEIGATWLFKVIQNSNALDLSHQRIVSSVRALFEPHYFKVIPGLDLSVPIGFGYGISGQSNLYFGPIAGTGDFEVGIAGTYRSVFQARLVFTAYAGPPSRQVFADRNFLLFSVEHTF